MEDPFEFHRKLDAASGAMFDEAKQRMDDSYEQARARWERLQPLDADHFYDPVDHIIFQKVGTHYRDLGHEPVYLEMAAEKAEEAARAQGFVPVKGGLFWNPTLKHLYVKQGEHYVLYSLERRAA